MRQQQHYIPKVLTKPWERPNSGRHVWYFDWDKNQVLESSSKSLFAKNDLWSEDYEIFNKKFEGRLIAQLYLVALINIRKYLVKPFDQF